MAQDVTPSGETGRQSKRERRDRRPDFTPAGGGHRGLA